MKRYLHQAVDSKPFVVRRGGGKRSKLRIITLGCVPISLYNKAKVHLWGITSVGEMKGVVTNRNTRTIVTLVPTRLTPEMKKKAMEKELNKIRGTPS